MKKKLLERQLFKFISSNNHLLLVFSISFFVFTAGVVYNFGRFGNMGTFKYDTGNMTQLLHNTLQGRLLQFTDYNGSNVFRFSEHIDPTILLVIPFYLIWQFPKTLMFIQSLMLVLAVIPLFKISFIKLKSNWIATLIVLAFLFNPAVGNLLVSDFHAVTFCVIFIFLSYLSILKKQNLRYFLFFILAILSKENVALSYLIFSFVIYFVYKNKKAGIATFTISLIWSYVAIVALIPSFRESTGSLHASFNLAYGYLGESYLQIAKNLVLNPISTINILAQPARLKYFVDSLSLYGFMPIFAFPYNLMVLPELLLNGFSNIDSMRNLNYQYTAIITPFLFIAMINFMKKFNKVVKLQFLILIAIVAFNLYYSFVLNNTTLQFIKNNFIKTQTSKTVESNLTPSLFSPRFTTTPYTIVKLIPVHESVSAPNFMGAHLSQREKIAMYPAKFNEFDNVVVEYYQSSLPSIVFSLYKRNTFEDNRQNVAFLLQSSKYKLILAENGLAYFKKVISDQNDQLPQFNLVSEERFFLGDNIQLTKPVIHFSNNETYLVIKLSYKFQSDKPVIYSLKTSTRQFQIMDLYQYAKLKNSLEYTSIIPVLLTSKDLQNPIEIAVSEHIVDSVLTIKQSQNFIIFDNIKVTEIN